MTLVDTGSACLFTMVMERKNVQSPPGTSEENIQQEDNEEQDEEDEDEEEGFPCAGCQSCSFECETRVDTQDELCESCEYEPSLEDAFSKFGHNDGGACRYVTGDVKNIIEGLGYEVKAGSWGCHNGGVITEIKRGDEIVYPVEGYKIGGYDARHYSAVLPHDINEALTNASDDWAYWAEGES